MGMLNPRGWLGIAATIVMAAALSACGGSDGDAGPQGEKGDQGDQGAQGPAGPAGSGAVNLAAISPEQWATAEFKGAITSVVVASPPVVTFTLTDKVGNPVVGLEAVTSKNSTATVASYPNLSFALAKLEPRTDAKPSSWVSYIVTTVPTTTVPAVAPTRPSTDNTG